MTIHFLSNPPTLPPPPLFQINTLEEPFLNVNCDHLARFSQDLYSQLVRYPQEVIPTFDLATNELFSKLYPDTTLEHGIQVCVCVCVCVFPVFYMEHM